MNKPYTPFIDWLKGLGMLLILYGHLAGWAPLSTFPPIYSKQLGVACFMFVSGYSLSGETRDRWRVAFNRLFEVYLYGLACAVLISLVLISMGQRPQPSNYLPFIGGANVLFNNFPANPTTWYLGTYVHLVLLWALFAHRLRVTAPVLVCSFLGEILVRAALMQTAGAYIAYMLLPNWSTVFLLGCWQRQRDDMAGSTVTSKTREPWSAPHTASVAALAVVAIGWSRVAASLPFDLTFPFMQLPVANPVAGALVVSTMVSTIYVGVTWLIFRTVEPLAAPAPIRFVARNTVVIFLAHMPVYYLLAPLAAQWTTSYQLRSVIYWLVCIPGLGLLSDRLREIVRPRQLRDRLYERVRASLAPAS